MTKGSEHSPSFDLTVGATYWSNGFFNVPVNYEKYLGNHDQSIDIDCQGLDEKIKGRINRTAQKNGTPRIMGGSPLQKWFQDTVCEGDRVKVTIPSQTWIRLAKLTGDRTWQST